MPFRWQINASSVAKLIGWFRLKHEPSGAAQRHRQEALAKTWLLNIKRMPKFQVRPSTTLQQELAKRQKTRTTEEAVQQAITPQMKLYVKKAIDGEASQNKVVHDIEAAAKRHALEKAQQSQQAHSKSIKDVQVVRNKVSELSSVITMKKYPKVSSGVSKTRVGGYFYTMKSNELKVYKKISAKKAVLTSLDQARNDRWKMPSEIQDMKLDVERAEKRARVSRQEAASAKTAATETREIAQNIRKVVTQEIQTTRGRLREDTDLKQVQRKAPSVRKGNKKAYFENFRGSPYGAFVIGYIDGFDTQTKTVIELKHRTRGLFRELRLYEKVQCFVYMKMCRCRKAKLIETFGDDQLEYDIEWDQAFWQNIVDGIHKTVQELNRIEQDATYRQPFIELLM